MEMTQGFIVLGKNPGLFVLGEPTHDREARSDFKQCVRLMQPVQSLQ